MKSIKAIMLLILFALFVGQIQSMSNELYKILEDVSKELFHVSAQELKDLVRQDIGLVNSISAQDLSVKMAQNPELLVINVLSANWHNDCHIAGSINIPLTEFIYKVGDFDRNQDIVVYCALDACDASEKAYILLHCMGFTSVFDYIGGIKEWFGLGLPVVGPCQASYLHKEQVRNFNCYNQDIEY